ncbi:MAG: DNA methyltransferase [Thermotogota bacterium]|nr:DNA methyltransferase [Thermotogota bacterium]
MQLFQIEERKLSDIIIKDRTRTEVSGIDELADNISMIGQLSPIIIDSNNHLVDGLRRIRATEKLGKETIEVRVVDNLSKDDSFLIELLSNMDRDPFAWHEEIELKYKLHNHWKEEAKKKKKSWGYRETAKRLRCSLGGLSTDLAFAEALKIFPVLKEQSTKGRAREMYKSLGKQAAALQRMNEFTEEEKERLQKLQSGEVGKLAKNTIGKEALDKTNKAKEKVDQFNEENKEAPKNEIKVIYVAENYKTFLQKIPTQSVGVVELDPPYAIDFESTYGKTSKIQSKATDWTEKELYEFYYNYLPLIYEKVIAGGWILCWTGKEHYVETNRIAKETGFEIQQPGAWMKPGGSTNQPKKNMISNWEMFLLFRKGEAQFNTSSLLSAITMITVPSSKRIHQWEKPIELYDYFLKALHVPGTIFLSPFAGSGNCLISAAKFKMQPIGCDKSQKYIPQFYTNLHNYLGINAQVSGL